MFMLLFSFKVTFDPFLVALRLLAVYIVWFRLFTVCNVSFTVLFVPNETSHLNDFRHVI